MRLSSNFTLKEFTRSQFATRHGIDNTPKSNHIENLRRLCDKVLQPARNALGALDVTSGFRCDRLNTAIGGSSSSQHRLGEAADVEPNRPDVSNLELAHWIVENVQFDQLILEYYDPKEGPHSGWVHVSYREGDNRKQLLTKIKGVPGYKPGLPDL